MSHLSYIGINALGGLLSGQGLRNVGNLVSENIRSAGNNFIDIASNAIALAISNEDISDSIKSSLRTIGSEENLGYGAFTGRVEPDFVSLGYDFAIALKMHTNELFGENLSHMTQTFASAETFANISSEMAIVETDIRFGQNPAAISGVLPENGDFGNYLGISFPDPQASITNGLSTLSDDLSLLAEDLANLGTLYDLQDIEHFGNPGQIISAVFEMGAEHITGISDALMNIGLDSNTNWIDSSFNDQIREALSSITDRVFIDRIQLLFDTDIRNIVNLGDLTNLEKLLPSSFNVVPFDDFTEFRQYLTNMEIGSIFSLSELGNVIKSIETININTDNVIESAALNAISDRFLGGTGPQDKITMIDLIGSIGGVGIEIPGNFYIDALDRLDQMDKLSEIKAIYQELIDGINNSDMLGNIDLNTGMLSVITDPRDSSEHTNLDSFVTNKIDQLNAELMILTNDMSINEIIRHAIDNWRIMVRKIFDEKRFIAKTNLRLDSRETGNEYLYYFTEMYADRASDPEKYAIINGMAKSDMTIYGRYWEAYGIENRNRNILLPFDVRWQSVHIGE